MAWTALGVAGLICLAVAALLAFGPAAGLAVAGVSMVALALDARSDDVVAQRRPDGRVEFR